MTITDWIQAISMVVLVVVTGIYAWRTHVISKATKAQADASVKMAEEMRAQRHDTVRPVIDFKFSESYPIMAEKESTIKKQEEGNLSSGLRCVLHNIGIGTSD